MEIAFRNQHRHRPFNILHLKIVFFCHVFCFSFPIIFILNIVLFIYSVNLQCLIYLIGHIRYFLYLREGRKLKCIFLAVFDRKNLFYLYTVISEEKWPHAISFLRTTIHQYFLLVIGSCRLLVLKIIQTTSQYFSKFPIFLRKLFIYGNK